MHGAGLIPKDKHPAGTAAAARRRATTAARREVAAGERRLLTGVHHEGQPPAGVTNSRARPVGQDRSVPVSSAPPEQASG